MKFKDLEIGDTFDFVNPDKLINSFFASCTKVSARRYAWTDATWAEDPRTLATQVGSIHVAVYHVNEH